MTEFLRVLRDLTVIVGPMAMTGGGGRGNYGVTSRSQAARLYFTPLLI